MGSIAIFSVIISMTVFGLVLYIGVTLFNYFFSRKGRSLIYRDFYECGFRAVTDNNLVVDIHYTILGLVFLIYEMEVILLVPIFLNLGGLNFTLVFLLLLSLLVLALSYWYEWERYALTWTF